MLWFLHVLNTVKLGSWYQIFMLKSKINSAKATNILFRSLTSCFVKCYCGLLNKQNPTGFSLLLPLLNSFLTFLAFLHPPCWASPPRQ